MVHQHFMLIPVFTVTENIMLGAETIKGGQLDHRTVSARVRELSHQYGLDIDPGAYVRTCPWACSSEWRSSKPFTAMLIS